jgi:hypothetical protein
LQAKNVAGGEAARHEVCQKRDNSTTYRPAGNGIEMPNV